MVKQYRCSKQSEVATNEIVVIIIVLGGHPLSMYAKFFENLTFLTP